ncbi:hypothetical protein QC762_100280 [Podospora pseudocomata]|uniref:Uncharacterized protein n=1 Tax=Podospora pseudocomata TaxID=2093779 RepID=A0ABR0GRP1_9PEZI|nr:hypothetical protein QC762_100280 [Podospora pseudocomata]
MPRVTRRSTKRKAEEEVADKTAVTSTNQQSLPNTRFGQASEVITRYFGIQGVPRRFTKPSSDNGSTDSIHSCPPSSEDEYEDEVAIVEDMQSEPAPQLQEGTESSTSLVTEWLSTTPEPDKDDTRSIPSPWKTRKTTSETSTLSASKEHQPCSPLNSQDLHHQSDSMDIDPPRSPQQTSLSFKPIEPPSTDFEFQVQYNTISGNKLKTRSLSPYVSGSPLGGESELVQRPHSIPPERTTPNLVLETVLGCSDLFNRGDASASQADISESLVDDQLHLPILPGEQIPITEHQISAWNPSSSRSSSPLSSPPDSPTMQLLDMINFPVSATPSALESADSATLPTTEACSEPRTSPVYETSVQALDQAIVVPLSAQPAPIPDHSYLLRPSVQSAPAPVRHAVPLSKMDKVPRVASQVPKKRALVVGSREERDILVRLYVQEAGELTTIKTKLSYLGNRIGQVKGVKETERMLRILGQAEDDGELTLRSIHRKRAEEIRQRDAKVEGQNAKQVKSGEERSGSLSTSNIKNIVGDGAVAAKVGAADSTYTDISMTDVGDKVDVDSGANLEQPAVTKGKTAAKEEHIEDMIHVCMGLFTSRQDLARTTKAAGANAGNETAGNPLESWALHTCAKCRLWAMEEEGI